jgi:integrase
MQAEAVLGSGASGLLVTPRDRRFSKSSLYYYWNPVRAAFGRPGMDYYELRHFCATHLLELGVSHAM